LLDEVRKSLPRDFASRQHVTYVEPFVGGGAVMFWILQAYPNIERAVINDINQELICTYRVIKENVEELIAELAHIQEEYIPLDAEDRKAFFIEKRARFNTKQTTPVETAALFIFLNRTCFNGLYRVNSKGEFNVPHGKYANPRICDADNLRACSSVLQRVEILCGDFAETGRFAGLIPCSILTRRISPSPKLHPSRHMQRKASTIASNSDSATSVTRLARKKPSL